MCDASDKTLNELEQKRDDIVRDMYRKITRIQNIRLPDAQIMDLNDEINALFREKIGIERRIQELGGRAYLQESGSIDTQKYRYFGRARTLSGVQDVLNPQKRESRDEQVRMVDLAYFGYIGDVSSKF